MACDKCLHKKREFKARDNDSNDQNFVPVYVNVAEAGLFEYKEEEESKSMV